jgi:hypothetical protein
MAGPLASANREIREAELADHARKLARLKRPRRLTDQLLEQLEELNLDDVSEVPARLGPNLEELAEAVREWPQIEGRFGSRLRPGVRTSDLIDTIFSIQEILTPPVAPGRPEIEADDPLLTLPDEPDWPLRKQDGR